MDRTEKLHYLECSIVLELTSPLHIGSGEPDGQSDAGVVRDYNGLPGLPGSSVKGMLRAACEEKFGQETTRNIFGYPGEGNSDTGRGGRLWVSWGVIHNTKNEPVKKHLSSKERDQDLVLRDATRPMLRDHVRLTDRGVAEDRGKFDELSVNAGHRFTVELRLATLDGSQEEWKKLHSILCDPLLRMGGKTRRSFGGYEIIKIKTNHPVACGEKLETDDHKIFDGELSSQTLWMFGGGFSNTADSAPVSGTRIRWEDLGNKEPVWRGTIEPVWIVPGSSIKGAIAHRTLFHANRIAGHFIDSPNPEAENQARGWLDCLFGVIKQDTSESGKIGKVLIEDVFLPKGETCKIAAVQNHVAINPFTGGARDTALFNDAPLAPATIPLKIGLKDKKDLPAEAIQALQCAVDDICKGRLSLGAHGGRGYGVFASSLFGCSKS
ncbi:conserved hypothetical protein [Gammaproteobacteria bacterium]